SSAARHAVRIASTVVAWGCNCTPTWKRAIPIRPRWGPEQASELRLGEGDAAAALLERDRGFTRDQPPDRLADQRQPPPGGEAALARRDQRAQVGARREQRRFEIELGGPLHQPRADDGD